jgi:hypothetical protein
VRWQLRDFRIRRGALEQFAAEWCASVAPARVAAGFSIVGPWLVPDENRFIWILGYDGDFEAADEACYAARAIEPDPARLVEGVSAVFMEDPPARAAAT